MALRTFSLCLLVGALSIAVTPALAQTTDKARAAAVAVAKAKAAEAAADRRYKVPRTGYGQPDLSGTWTNVSITPFERPSQYGAHASLTPEQAAQLETDAVARFDEGNAPTDPNAPAADTTSKHCQGPGGLDCGYNSGWKDSGTTVARIDGVPVASFINSTPDGHVPPYKADYKGPRGRLQAEGEGEGAPGAPRRGRTDNPETFALGERCLTSFAYSAGPVMLPLMYNNNYQFVQSRDAVAILVEMVHDVRIVRIGGVHRTDGIRPWFGDSIGHYEGDTLVVETTNFPKAQAFRGSWAQLKVTEKFTRKGPRRMLYQFTVEDPTVWDQPWGGAYEFTTATGPLYEYACHEGNYALTNMLAGARAEEQRASAKATAAGVTSK
jgi:hypothetical protein